MACWVPRLCNLLYSNAALKSAGEAPGGSGADEKFVPGVLPLLLIGAELTKAGYVSFDRISRANSSAGR